MALLRTPLHSQHVALRARMVPFAGYEMPVQYSGVLEEAKQTRLAAGLFDVSHMGQVVVRGSGAVAAVNKLVTNDLGRAALGQAQYTLLCNPKGGVIDDLIAYRRREDEVFICVNAANRAIDVAWFREHLDKSVEFEDQSEELSLIAVQGPLAETLMTACADPALVQQMSYYWASETKVFGIPCYLSRTGYTGEDGFEIYVDNAQAANIWNGLMDIGRPKGLVPVGLGARDTLRLEMGYPLHGHELSETISPLEAGLGWVVKLKKSDRFIGQDALEKQAANGLSRQLLGFGVEDRRMARQGSKILTKQGKVLGEVTSGTFSPHLHHPIALGFVDASHAKEKDFLLEVRTEQLPMHAHPLPFTPSHTKRKTS